MSARNGKSAAKLFALCLFIFFFVVSSALCDTGKEKFIPDPLELAPENPVVCDWSSAQYQELKQCRKRRDFFNRMTKEEKLKYNEEVEQRRREQVVVHGGGTEGTAAGTRLIEPTHEPGKR